MPEADAVLLDNVVLSNFLLADGMGILAASLSGRMWVTPEVLTENAAGRVAGHRGLEKVDELLAGGHVQEVALTAAERRTFLELLGFLGRGEASSTAVAASRNAAVASDDRVAREAARLRGIGVTGTIGILVAAVRRGAAGLTEADHLLERMIEAGFYAPLRSIRGLV